jgi:hypothetical protein
MVSSSEECVLGALLILVRLFFSGELFIVLVEFGAHLLVFCLLSVLTNVQINLDGWLNCLIYSVGSNATISHN